MIAADSLAVPPPVRPHARRPIESAPPVSNGRLAMMVVVAGESMLFTGLIGAYIVFRFAARDWPPPGLPRLPIALTAVNTLILFASTVAMTRALRAVRRDDHALLERTLLITVSLGALFLGVQGLEWTRLVHHGLTLASGTYGSVFYVLIGCHGAHVLLAVGWLAVTTVLAHRGVFTAAHHVALEMCAIYWYFVCALWALLFPLVYLY